MDLCTLEKVKFKQSLFFFYNRNVEVLWSVGHHLFFLHRRILKRKCMAAQKPSWQMQNGYCTTVLYTMEVCFIVQQCVTDSSLVRMYIYDVMK